MTREKEIKILADFLKQDCLNKPNDYCLDTDCYICRATALVDNGWHKEKLIEVGFSHCECPSCKGWTLKSKKYCHICGEKMTEGD